MAPNGPLAKISIPGIILVQTQSDFPAAARIISLEGRKKVLVPPVLFSDQQEPILNFYLSSMVEEEPSDKKPMQKQDLLQWLIVKRSNRNSLGISKQKNSALLKTDQIQKTVFK